MDFLKLGVVTLVLNGAGLQKGVIRLDNPDQSTTLIMLQ